MTPTETAPTGVTEQVDQLMHQLCLYKLTQEDVAEIARQAWAENVTLRAGQQVPAYVFPAGGIGTGSPGTQFNLLTVIEAQAGTDGDTTVGYPIWFLNRRVGTDLGEFNPAGTGPSG